MPLWVFFIHPNQQERVRRLVSCVSTVVGLVCYCYSTSFIHLFGEWNWWKIFLYLLFSCLASLAVLFQKEWSTVIIPRQHESLSRFLVATSTTILLFFSDRASKGESDAYGVISCVAFAVMSLTCGFDELLTVFTGALMVQLMGIKLFLAALGVVLCFIFIVPTPYLQRYLQIQGQPHHDELQSFQNEDHVIVDIDSLLLLPSNRHHHHQTQLVSYYLPSSIVEDQEDQRVVGVNDEIQDGEVVEVIASFESSEDDEDQEEGMVVDETQEVVDYYSTDDIPRYLLYLLEQFRFIIGRFSIRVLIILDDTIIHLIFVRYDIVCTSMDILRIFIPEPQSDEEGICKDHGRWLVSDVKKSLANISLVPLAGYANLVNRFQKVLARCYSDVLTRMERLTSKAQNALRSTSIFSCMDPRPRMNIKLLKLD